MVTRQVYSTGKDKSTWDGGYTYAVARIERDNLGAEAVTNWWVETLETPKSERSNFWFGMNRALVETMGRMALEMEAAA